MNDLNRNHDWQKGNSNLDQSEKPHYRRKSEGLATGYKERAPWSTLRGAPVLRLSSLKVRIELGIMVFGLVPAHSGWE